MEENKNNDIIDFGPVVDTTQNIIKVVGVGGGGCNAVGNMYMEGMDSVTFAVCNTDSKNLAVSLVPTKIMLGQDGHGAGADPMKGRHEAEISAESLKKLFSDHTQMVFVVAAMGGGTGTGAGPYVAGVAKEMGMLTIGIVTIPFYFERRPKIIKALKGIDEMRKNVDALLIINNEQISKVYSDSHIPVNDALKMADNVMGNAVRSIAELITVTGKIQTDFSDVKTTMCNGGGAVMAIGRASGEHRVQKAVLDALDSPLLYGSDISKATRILINIYTSQEHELYVDELEEIDAFMDELDPNISVIWGMATDDTLDEDAKITILATGFDNSIPSVPAQPVTDDKLDEIIEILYGRSRKKKVQVQPEPKVQENTDNADTETNDTEPVTSPDEPDDTGTGNDEDDNGCDNEDESENVDPSKGFLNRVKERIIRGLDILTSPEA